eukprot:g17868.t1
MRQQTQTEQYLRQLQPHQLRHPCHLRRLLLQLESLWQRPEPLTICTTGSCEVTDGSGRLGNNLAFILRGIIYAKLTHHVAVQFSITSKSVKELFEPKAVLQLSSSKLEGQRFCPEKSDKRQEGRPIYNFQGERCKGMGVDSGLGTFRGRNAGVWPPLKAMQMDFSEMSSPDWFDTDPRLAWAFWRFRHQAYTLGEPHRGYSLLAEWGNKMKYGLFSVTSNIDGHWDRTEGVGPAKVWERHGALTRMQCVEDDESIWPTDAKDLTSIEVPEWDLQAGDEVLALVAGAEVPAVVQEDGCSLAVDGEPVSAKAVRRKDGPDLLRSLPGSRLPRSREGKPARPNVLMFSDFGVNMRIISEQEQRFNAWLKELPESANLVIVEDLWGMAEYELKSDKPIPMEANAHHWLWHQPPCTMYRKIIVLAQFDISVIVVTSPDLRHVCVEWLKSNAASLGIEVVIQSGSLMEDFCALAKASNLVLSFSTLGDNAAVLNKRVKKIFFREFAQTHSLMDCGLWPGTTLYQYKMPISEGLPEQLVCFMFTPSLRKASTIWQHLSRDHQVVHDL